MRLLTPKDVADIMCVSERTAKIIMAELPHIDACVKQDSKKPKLRITEDVLNSYLAGLIQRIPQQPIKKIQSKRNKSEQTARLISYR